MKKALLALAAVAALAIPTTTSALAYPAGQAPVLAFSTVGRIIPGNNVSVQISRVKKDCVVSVAWTDSDESISPVSKTIKATGKSGVISIATPTTAGTYTLSTDITGACAGGDPVTLNKTVVVGKVASIVGKLTTTSGFISKSPVLSAKGTIKSGSVAVANQAITVKLKKGINDVKTVSGTTNGSGAFTVSLAGASLSAGTYKAEISIAAGSIYGSEQIVTANLVLR